VFTCSGTPCAWTQQRELTASNGARGDEFGYSVAMSGNTAIIGAAYKNSYQGAAYVFNSPAVAITVSLAADPLTGRGAAPFGLDSISPHPRAL
jgi:FG-GAP repeat protein